MPTKVKTSIWAEVNKEWWILLSLFVISALLTSVDSVNQMLLFLYILPTLFSAYLFGRRHATLTAIASVFIVVGGTFARDALMHNELTSTAQVRHWWEIAVWGGILVLTAYATGTLFRETHQSYDGMLLLMRSMVLRNSRQGSIERVGFYSATIAEEMGWARDQIELVRTSALLSDISNLDISPEALRKVLRMAAAADSRNADSELRMMQRVLPVLIARKQSAKFGELPMEARIVAVAEEFGSTISAGERRSALPASVARNVIERGSGVKFDPEVVTSFLKAYDAGKLTLEDGAQIEAAAAAH